MQQQNNKTNAQARITCQQHPSAGGSDNPGRNLGRGKAQIKTKKFCTNCSQRRRHRISKGLLAITTDNQCFEIKKYDNYKQLINDKVPYATIRKVYAKHKGKIINVIWHLFNKTKCTIKHLTIMSKYSTTVSKLLSIPIHSLQNFVIFTKCSCPPAKTTATIATQTGDYTQVKHVYTATTQESYTQTANKTQYQIDQKIEQFKLSMLSIIINLLLKPTDRFLLLTTRVQHSSCLAIEHVFKFFQQIVKMIAFVTFAITNKTVLMLLNFCSKTMDLFTTISTTSTKIISTLIKTIGIFLTTLIFGMATLINETVKSSFYITATTIRVTTSLTQSIMNSTQIAVKAITTETIIHLLFVIILAIRLASTILKAILKTVTVTINLILYNVLLNRGLISAALFICVIQASTPYLTTDFFITIINQIMNIITVLNILKEIRTLISARTTFYVYPTIRLFPRPVRTITLLLTPSLYFWIPSSVARNIIITILLQILRMKKNNPEYAVLAYQQAAQEYHQYYEAQQNYIDASYPNQPLPDLIFT